MPLVTSQLLSALNTGFNASWNIGFQGATTYYDKICMMTTSRGSDEVYAWLGEMPQIREWLGDRRIQSLVKHGFKIENRKFESTISVPRTEIEDDRVGVFAPMFKDFGRGIAEFPDHLLTQLIEDAFTSPCYDGQNFFDTEHPASLYGGGDVEDVVQSNFQDGAGPAWYLLDLTRAVRPFIYQERIKFSMDRMNFDPNDEHVFLVDEYLWGTRGRCNVGYGLWQLAYASKAELTPENYEAARIAMSTRKGETGKLLGIRPSTLLVPSALEGRGRKILKNPLGEAGESNSWVDSAELIVSPWLS
jgi:phage major head subunit gpT-like protein